MSLQDDQQQNIQMQLDFSSAPTGEAREAGREETESPRVTSGVESPAETNLMEEVCERENLKGALRQVKANQGSPGVDGMTVVGLKDYLKEHWPAIREQLLKGTYEPKPVRRVEIPKPDGGVRKLGIRPPRVFARDGLRSYPAAIGELQAEAPASPLSATHANGPLSPAACESFWSRFGCWVAQKSRRSGLRRGTPGATDHRKMAKRRKMAIEKPDREVWKLCGEHNSPHSPRGRYQHQPP